MKQGIAPTARKSAAAAAARAAALAVPKRSTLLPAASGAGADDSPPQQAGSSNGKQKRARAHYGNRFVDNVRLFGMGKLMQALGEKIVSYEESHPELGVARDGMPASDVGSS